MNKRINIAEPLTGEQEWLAVKEPIMSGWLTQGPKVSEFEQKFAKLHGVKHAIATTSCTTALHLGLVALGIKPGDEVIIPAFTWVATANVVLYCGATPVFCDVDQKTFNIDANQLAQKITSKTRAIIPVHLFGLCADIDAINSIIPDKYKANIKILEDAACATGAFYKDRAAGSLGDMAAFSFHPRKSITTGEGGMLTTNDDELANMAIKLRNHGAEISEEARHNSNKPYLLPEFNVLGYNYRMTDLQAAVGIVQLDRIHSIIEERTQMAIYYKDKLNTESSNSLGWLIPQLEPDYCSQHAYQAFVCYVDPTKSPKPRNTIMEILLDNNISTRPGTHAVHLLNYYKNNFGLKPEEFPGALNCNDNTMALPLHNKMSKSDFEYILEELHAIR